MNKNDENKFFDNLNILCFNRPEYASKVFNSINNQLRNSRTTTNINIWIECFHIIHQEAFGTSYI